MKQNLLIRLIGITFLFNSCAQNQEDELASYYRLKPLLEHQIDLLNKLQPTVIKKISLDGKLEQSESQLDSSQWANEFEIFLESDINRPSLVGSFDENIERNRISYLLKDQSQDGVKEFEILLKEGSNTPQEIKIKSSSENSLYTSARSLMLTFDTKDGNNPVLSSYSISGDQTILSGVTTTYLLEAEVKF